jgi:hypothetical protein
MVYWKNTSSSPAITTTESYDFDLQIDPGLNNSQICIRGDLAIRFDGDGNWFPPPSYKISSTIGSPSPDTPNAYTTYSASDNSHITATHLVKQSDEHCLFTKWSFTNTYAATLYAMCHLDNGPGYAAGTGNIFGSLTLYDGTGNPTGVPSKNYTLSVWEAGAWKIIGLGTTNSQGNYLVSLPNGITGSESAAQLFGDGVPRDFMLSFSSPVSPSTFTFSGVYSTPSDCNPSSPVVSAGASCVNQVLYGNAQDPDDPGSPITVDVYINGGAQYYTTVQTTDQGDFAVGLPGFQNGYDQNFVLWAHDYSGNAANTEATAYMQGCGQFKITPTAGGGLDDTENPTQFTANNWARVTYPGWANPNHPAIASSDSNYILTPSGAQIPGGSDTSFIDRNYVFSYGPPLPAITAGQAYCSYINIGSPSAGIVSNTGQILRVDAGGAPDHKCDTVVNKPTFKVYGSGVATGGDVGACSANGGLLAGWNNYNSASGFNYGSGSQLSALALIKITGFASAQKVTVPPYNAPNLLSFANNNTPSTSTDSTDGGGNFGGQNCITEPNPSPVTSTTNTYGPATLTPTSKVAIDAPGDVYIAGNVLYQGNNGATGTAADWSSADQIPSVVVRAKGNIYINQNVKELDGIYVAEGKIYTCASGLGTPVPATNLYSSCSNQLVVYGSLIGKQVNLMRTYGSLRDEKPTASFTTGPDYNLQWTLAGGVPKDPYATTTPPNGGIKGMRCTYITEGAEPSSSTWNDDYLCVNTSAPVHLAWTHWANSPYNDPAQTSDPGNLSLAYYQSKGYLYCTQWDLSGVDPDTWGDNWLCSDQNIGLNFRATNDPSQYCTQVYENSDPDATWAQSKGGYYVCYTKNIPAGLTAPSVGTSCSNAPATSVRVGTSPGGTCAAEVFDFGPEFFLSNPNVLQPSGGAQQFDSILSLPPVL